MTPAVLHDLVNKVYVCAPDKSSGHRVQDVRISLACIGFLPESIISEMVNHTQDALSQSIKRPRPRRIAAGRAKAEQAQAARFFLAAV